MVNLLFNAEEDVRVLAASVLGVCLTFADDAVFDSIVRTTILTTSLAELSSERRRIVWKKKMQFSDQDK